MQSSTPLLLALTLAGLCGPGLAVAAAQTTLYDLPSGAALERHGAAVRAAGDLDGDGVPDLLIGAPGALGSLGEVRLVSGDKGTLIGLLTGSSVTGEFGGALDSADLDADGRADPIVGAWLAGSGAAGEVTVFSAKSGAVLLALKGTSPADHFGFSVVALGDLSGDKIRDFAVGAIDDDDQGPSSGSVRVCSGADGSTLYTLTGTSANELFGYALCALPDVDGDGRGDLAIGAPAVVTPGSTAPGSVRVVSGASGATLFAVPGKAGADAYGRALALLGDLDGDAHGDLAVGAPQPTGGKTGYVQILSSASGKLLLEVVGTSGGAQFGAALARGGDVNADGTPDLAVGEPRADDGGLDAGAVRLMSGKDGALLDQHIGALPGAHLGAALDGGFDPNGDGVEDLVLGAPDASGGSTCVSSTRPLTLWADSHLLALSSGGTIALSIDAGAAQAGLDYALLGSISGTKPGVVLAGSHLALNPDRYLAVTLRQSAQGPLTSGFGMLDAAGRAQASLQVPTNAPASLLMGMTFRHACLVLGPSGAGVLASNTVPVTLVP